MSRKASEICFLEPIVERQTSNAFLELTKASIRDRRAKSTMGTDCCLEVSVIISTYPQLLKSRYQLFSVDVIDGNEVNLE